MNGAGYTVQGGRSREGNELKGDHYPLMKIRYHILGDINFDGKVSLADLVILANAYGAKLGDSNWNPNADIDGNGIVGLSDLVILAQNCGQHNP